MSEYNNFIRKDLDDGFTVCEDVHLPSGSVCTVFFSSSGIYVVGTAKKTAEDLWWELRKLLSPIRLRLYVLEDCKGNTVLVDSEARQHFIQMDDDALSEDVQSWLTTGHPVYDKADTERQIALLKSADMKGRGYVVDVSGDVFLYRHGTLHRASKVSSESQYVLTLLGGTLGLHRFSMGKPMSGLIYLLTGGLMLTGWLLDLVMLFAGIQKDSKKQYLLPLKNLRRKLLFLPIGLLCGLLPFLVYLNASDLFGLGIQSALAEFVKNTDPEAAQNFLNMIQEYVNRLE